MVCISTWFRSVSQNCFGLNLKMDIVCISRCLWSVSQHGFVLYLNMVLVCISTWLWSVSQYSFGEHSTKTSSHPVAFSLHWRSSCPPAVPWYVPPPDDSSPHPSPLPPSPKAPPRPSPLHFSPEGIGGAPRAGKMC